MSQPVAGATSARVRLVVGVAALALLLAGCASVFPPAQTAALRVTRPADLEVRAERAEVPFFPQTPYHCGPAALATVLPSAGFDSTPEQLAQAVFLPSREGTLQTEMLSGARRVGALALRLPPQLTDVLREVQRGTPVIVLQNLGLSFAPRWHYAVVVGYDLPRDEVVLRSGTTEREVLSLATFEYTWARGGRWAMVVMRPGQLPATVLEADAVQAAVGFERVALPTQAAMVYDSVLQRWPDSRVAAIGLGNALQAAGDLDGAARAFEGAAQRHGGVVAWNNLATVLLMQGRREAAQQAARRAVESAQATELQWLPEALDTLASTRR